MALIDISDLTFAHPGGENIFEQLNLQLDTAWRLGLIGRNGRGKTTFLQLLAGHYEYAGRIASPLHFQYFPFDVPDAALPAREVLFAVAPEAEAWELEREASLLEVEAEALSRPFAGLSGGERTKLLLAGLFARQGSFMLIDEPTNHLDMHGRAVLGRYLARKRGFILVSHDRSFLDAAVDHVMSINRAGIEVQRGNFSSWQENKERRDSFELAQNQRLKKDIKRLGASARQAAEWSGKTESTKFGEATFEIGFLDRGFIGHKAAKMMQRAKNVAARREKALEEKSALLKNIENEAPLIIRPQSHHSRRLVEARGLTVNYGGRDVLAGFGFELLPGERVALAGRNGAGKSSILKLIVGEGIPHSGELRVASGLIVSYVPQDTSHLRGSLKDYARDLGIGENLFRAVLHRLGFERHQFEGDLAAFSAGQKKKALIAASLCREAHLYVWDEPLNYIDVISRLQIERLIVEYRPSLLLVEHDRAFLEAVGARVVELG